MKPARKILSMMDMAKWKKSKAYTEYLHFINNLNDAAKDTNLTASLDISPAVQNILNLIKKLNSMIDETPPIQQPQRFGNKGFKTWLNKVKENIENLLSESLDAISTDQIEEISTYLIESFGNDTRIDYGTGHEMAFAMFLMCLFKANVLKKEDATSSVVKIFYEYLVLARKLQTTYNMEPAGSHGVWSLDDFQFLPFIFGSAQLINNRKIEPCKFTDPNYVEMYKDEFMFFSCIKFITQVKTGPFAEHSNQLWNISSVQSWSKVNSGLIKMYIAEVVDKFPVVQHVLFGNFISIDEH